jgi:hypothetical protein
MPFITASNVGIIVACYVRAVRKAIRRPRFLKAADPGDQFCLDFYLPCRISIHLMASVSLIFPKYIWVVFKS